MFEEVYGNVFDHHSVIYEYANGVRLYAFCRTQVGCYDESSSILLGAKGRCNLTAMRIVGDTNWSYAGPPENPVRFRIKRPHHGGQDCPRSLRRRRRFHSAAGPSRLPYRAFCINKSGVGCAFFLDSVRI